MVYESIARLEEQGAAQEQYPRGLPGHVFATVTPS